MEDKEFEFDRDDPLAVYPEETAKSHRALIDYVNMGPGRSQRKLAEKYEELGADDAPTVHLSVVHGWSARFAWMERVKAYEANEFKRIQKAMREVEVQERLKARQDRRKLLNDFLEQLLNQVPGVELTEARLSELSRAILVAVQESRKEYGDEPAAKNVQMDIDMGELTDDQLERLAAGESIDSVLGF